MGNLSNLFISTSYQSLIHLGNDSTVSSSLVELQDGLGNSIGVSVNSAGDLSISGSLTASLEEGYALVGGVGNETKAVPTSSFGGSTNLGPLNQFTASQDLLNTQLLNASTSFEDKFDTLATQSGSWDNLTDITALNAFTASQETYNTNNDTKWNTIGTKTGSYATTGSNSFVGNEVITGSLTITGSSPSQKLVVKSQNENSVISQTVITFNSSSILQAVYGQDGSYVTNNTKGLVNGTSEFAINNGLVNVPINQLGLFYGTASGFYDGTTLISADTTSDIITIGGNGSSTNISGSFTASLQPGYAWVGNNSGVSTQVPTSSFAENTDLGPLNSFTASQETKNNTLGLYTASVDTQLSTIGSVTSSLNSYTSSNDTKWSNLGSQSGSFVLESETGSFARTNIDNTFGGTQSFLNIAVAGTASIAYLQSVTGSAKIIGDAFIILNNDTPAERYAGIIVQDSGSTQTTASFEFDGQTNDWFYDYTTDGGVTTDYGVALFGPEYSTKGAPTYLTNNRIPKSIGSHHLNDSSISDDGTTVSVGANLSVTGSIQSNGTSVLLDGALSNLNSYTASQDLVNTQLLNASTSFEDKFTTIGTQSGSWENVPLTSLNSFTASQEVLNDTFATTGSNTFVGQQNIQNTLVIEENGNPLINTNLQQDSLTGKLIIQQSGGNGILFNNLNVGMNELTASLQEGYAWVGGAGNITNAVPTSSFGGGGTIVGYATTGSNTFDGNQIITGSLNVSTDITADRLVLTGGTGIDLIVTGSARISNTLNVGPATGDQSFMNQYGFSAINAATTDETGLTNNSVVYGVSGWDGPSIYGNDPSDTYPAFIGFQNQANWTDGTITVLKPMDITGSLSISGSINNSVHTLSITSNTASIDASVGSTFVLSLVDATNTRLEVSNTTYGQTLNLLVSQSSAGTGTLTFGENFYEPSGSFYSASAVANAKDIVTLATFAEPNVVYVASIKNLIV